MKVLVTGVKGQLGYDIVKALMQRGHVPIGIDVEDMDITDALQTEQVILRAQCDAVIHCAAYTMVDAAQDNEEVCRAVNAYGTKNIAKVCKSLNIPMMYFSTDYVFAGDGNEPWTTEAEKSPINVYGQTKYEGELMVQKYLDQYFIIRISWVFGINGKNFVKTMLNLGRTRDKLTVVNDQIGSPTYTKDLAVLAVAMIESEKYGVYHATNEGVCSWYEFACEIFKQAGISVNVEPVTSDQYPAKAKRPMNSRMDKSKLVQNGFELLPTWQNALARYLQELNN